jgi:hypothetical protein
MKIKHASPSLIKKKKKENKRASANLVSGVRVRQHLNPIMPAEEKYSSGRIFINPLQLSIIFYIIVKP